ncbi:GntR family transcriptional regulator [Streptomyces sp. NPDC090085]|uniref:GntR family transcriptional regulator n=1 Tax=Streptomyces sp. NPDC090085 TaxID=3365943 RepID=UPI0037FA9B8A
MQITKSLRWDILAGEYSEGDHLPSAGELGDIYGVNKNTILRALRALRSEGVIDFGRGRGPIVTHPARAMDPAEISQQLRQLITLADAAGIDRSAIIAAVQRIPRVPVRSGAAGRSASSARGAGPLAPVRNVGERGTASTDPARTAPPE